ncbi:MAG: hypothetical protein PHT12_00835 [Patescibacteria group bacterium]|nr:hypothetical protein [Patescibacteria group bacterium]
MRRFNINELADWQSPERRDDLPKCEFSGKDMHPNERSAKAAATWRESQAGTPMGVYFCVWCKAWHLTSSRVTGSGLGREFRGVPTPLTDHRHQPSRHIDIAFVTS